ncbi:hypothetical protein CMUS01_06440 [Colletotrichum musicola]|uniref:Uncharacterized protein n=1 Tax=Colletotrichum musicola TaxID=2175873 RepID=A0A8H6KMF6_9PEZI|nr:hypothetical protein CMUS01_06440 [Colletotrichum musicola]
MALLQCLQLVFSTPNAPPGLPPHPPAPKMVHAEKPRSQYVAHVARLTQRALHAMQPLVRQTRVVESFSIFRRAVLIPTAVEDEAADDNLQLRASGTPQADGQPRNLCAKPGSLVEDVNRGVSTASDRSAAQQHSARDSDRHIARRPAHLGLRGASPMAP